MEEEFTVSTGMKIFYCAIAVFMAGFALFLFNLDHSKAGPIVLLIPILLLLFAVLIVMTQLRRKIIISTDLIVKVSVFGTKELPTSNVKGCRIGEKVIFIDSDSASYPKINIGNYSDLSNSGNLINWLKENFKDLDSIDLANEKDELLSDGKLGATAEERQAVINRSKGIGWTYTGVGMFLGLIGIILDDKVAMIIILVLYPIIGILVMALSNGLIKFVSNTRRSVYSFTFLGMFTPALALCLTASLGYDFYNFHHAVWPAIVICLAVTSLIYVTGFNQTISSVSGQVFGMLLVSGIYAIGSLLQINCKFDNSAPQVVHTTVNYKSKEYNKREHYYLYLNPVSTDGDFNNTEVSEARYDKCNVGDDIKVDLRKGFLNIPWYYLPKNN